MPDCDQVSCWLLISTIVPPARGSQGEGQTLNTFMGMPTKLGAWKMLGKFAPGLFLLLLKYLKVLLSYYVHSTSKVVSGVSLYSKSCKVNGLSGVLV